ncbi:enolase C-terminal domain-like protein [Macrococcus bovicus]|uniref:enolase C-terminal domain-like protein n=1 Tax=Macrococcus bovicus TaxID=69968 RepID=UPI0025A661E3|nr:enolase C-terminal domain-like protein [Macrococcus bovicus]WJP97309.1 enolase C-terminal domain-like protein [Macrococcus bovicus]
MKFSNLQCYTYEAPFKHPIKTVKADLETRKVLVISLEVAGHTYYAESNAFETDWYHVETIETVYQSVHAIYEEINDIEWQDYAQLGALLAPFRRTPHAMALFDYIGWQSLNERAAVTVPLGYTLHSGQHIKPQNRVKIKWSEHVVERVKEIRAQYPEIRIAIDANGSLGEEDLPTLEALMTYDIDYFEEPFSDFSLYAANRHLPLAIDESASSIEAIIRYYGAGVRIIVAKYARFGGGYPLLAIKEAIPDLRVIVGGMYEYGLSKYFTALLASEFKTIPDVTPRGTYFAEDYAHYEEQVENGRLTMTFPVVDMNQLEELT